MAVPFPNMPTDWGQYLPQPEQYQTAQDYFAALKAAHDNAGFNQPAWGPPPDLSSMGAGWHAAGTTHAPSLGVQGAHDFQGAYERQFQEGVKSPAMTLAIGSRAALHPDEAQNAYDAYALSPEGLPNPLMDPAVYTALKALGYTNTRPAPVGVAGSGGNVPTPGGGASGSVHVPTVLPGAGGGPTMPGVDWDPNWKPGGPAPAPRPNDPGTAGGGSGLLPGATPPPKHPVGADQTPPGGPVERPKPENFSAMVKNHNYPPGFLDDLARLKKPMQKVLGY